MFGIAVGVGPTAVPIDPGPSGPPVLQAEYEMSLALKAGVALATGVGDSDTVVGEAVGDGDGNTVRAIVGVSVGGASVGSLPTVGSDASDAQPVNARKTVTKTVTAKCRPIISLCHVLCGDNRVGFEVWSRADACLPSRLLYLK
jgi:hypothetical protein